MFPEWDELYRTKPAEEMPWYHPSLDKDMARELKKRKLSKGAFLDIGAGPGTQAAELAELGFSVTGTDISAAAVKRAARLYSSVEFITDDITKTKLKKHFDFIFDRGCFHSLQPEDRGKYMKSVKKLLNNDGILVLKCFHYKETRPGPYRFSPADIQKIFSANFRIEKIEESTFEGVNSPEPKALFIVMRKR